MSLDIWLTIAIDTGNEPYTATLFDGNITHNVAPMWRKAGVYEALYESEGKEASEIAEVLQCGITDMEQKPEEYKILNAENGWGDYEGALRFLRNITEACVNYPRAIISVSR